MLAILTRRERANILIEARNTYAAVQVPNAKRGPFKYEDGKFFMDSLLALTAYESDSYVVKKVDRSIVKNPLGCSFVH